MNKIKIFSNNKKLRAEIERSLVNPYRSFKKNVSSIFKSSRTCCCGNPHLVCVQCKLTAGLRARFWACIMKGQLVRACGGVSAIELRRICMLTGRRHDVRVRGGSAQYVCGRPAQCGRNRRYRKNVEKVEKIQFHGKIWSSAMLEITTATPPFAPTGKNPTTYTLIFVFLYIYLFKAQ